MRLTRILNLIVILVVIHPNSYESITCDEEPIMASIDNFPVNMVLLECCEDTLDDYSKNEISHDE